MFLTRRRPTPDVRHIRSPPFRPRRFSASGQTNDWEPLFSHTQPLESLSALPLTSQGRCLCTVLLCHGRLVPLGSAPANPSLSLLGAGPVFSQGSLFISPRPPPPLLPPPPPHPVQPKPNPTPFQAVTVTLHAHTKEPWPSSVKTPRQKTASSLLLRHVARRPSLRGHKGGRGKKMQQLNNGWVVNARALSPMVQGQQGLIHFA